MNEASKANATSAPAKRKEKEPFEIDFLAPLSAEAQTAIYTAASTNSAIQLPKAQWKSKSRNLLPDDKHFNSRQLVRLFLKPKAQIGNAARMSSTAYKPVMQSSDALDEAYWAKQAGAPLEASTPENAAAEPQYDADFFQDDGLAFPGGLPDDDVDDDFADARDHFSPDADVDPAPAESNLDATAAISTFPEGMTQNMTAFGTQLVTQTSRLRPEYMQYARVAKKVDVRKLKEEMWKGIGFTVGYLSTLFSSLHRLMKCRMICHRLRLLRHLNQPLPQSQTMTTQWIRRSCSWKALASCCDSQTS
jgi:condensin complex subunit 2